MSRIIPRDLIKHLEWSPSQQPPIVIAPTRAKPVLMPVAADLQGYIHVGINGIFGNPVLISPFELDGLNNKKYEPTHRELFKRNLYMPTPEIMGQHVHNVFDAVNGRSELRYGSGDRVPDEVVRAMHDHLTTNKGNVYGSTTIGAWTWLNARFVKGSGAGGFDLETVTGVTESMKGKRKGYKLEVRKTPLEPFLNEDCYINLEFNGQGLAAPSAKSPSQSYSPGRTIYFYYPREGNVARFVAGSNGAFLNCYWDPRVSVAELGVFGCAESAVAKNSGGSAA